MSALQKQKSPSLKPCKSSIIRRLKGPSYKVSISDEDQMNDTRKNGSVKLKNFIIVSLVKSNKEMTKKEKINRWIIKTKLKRSIKKLKRKKISRIKRSIKT